jgi:hypothetical protein
VGFLRLRADIARLNNPELGGCLSQQEKSFDGAHSLPTAGSNKNNSRQLFF